MIFDAKFVPLSAQTRACTRSQARQYRRPRAAVLRQSASAFFWSTLSGRSFKWSSWNASRLGDAQLHANNFQHDSMLNVDQRRKQFAQVAHNARSQSAPPRKWYRRGEQKTDGARRGEKCAAFRSRIERICFFVFFYVGGFIACVYQAIKRSSNVNKVLSLKLAKA